MAERDNAFTRGLRADRGPVKILARVSLRWVLAGAVGEKGLRVPGRGCGPPGSRWGMSTGGHSAPAPSCNYPPAQGGAGRDDGLSLQIRETSGAAARAGRERLPDGLGRAPPGPRIPAMTLHLHRAGSSQSEKHTDERPWSRTDPQPTTAPNHDQSKARMSTRPTARALPGLGASDLVCASHRSIPSERRECRDLLDGSTRVRHGPRGRALCRPLRYTVAGAHATPAQGRCGPGRGPSDPTVPCCGTASCDLPRNHGCRCERVFTVGFPRANLRQASMPSPGTSVPGATALPSPRTALT